MNSGKTPLNPNVRMIRMLVCSQVNKIAPEAEEANRLKDDFLAFTSHELRTPLNAIVGWTTMLRSGKADQQLFDKGLEVIQRNALLQSRMIEELLDISRTVAGKIVFDNQPVEIASTIDEAVNNIRPAAEIVTNVE